MKRTPKHLTRQNPNARLLVEPLEARTAPTVVPVGGEFRANTYTTGEQGRPVVAVDAGGDFVVVWQSEYQDGSSYGVYARRYSAAGVPQGGEFRVNTFTTSIDQFPAVAMDAAGDFVVAWQSNPQDGSFYGVYAQAYRANGVPDGAEFLVNTYTTGYQENPAVAMDTAGDFVVAWESGSGFFSVPGQDGSGYGVYAQRYRLAPPPRVAATAVDGGAAQRSRVTDLAVTFSATVTFATTPAAAFALTRNSDGAAVTFTATANLLGGVTVVTLSNFTGLATQFSSLADGRYTLTALASQISADGQPLDGNGDGTGGDDYVLASAGAPNPPTGIFRFFGDLDGDGDVDAGNFLAFRDVFLGIAPYDPALDFDGSGSVDAADFLQFRNRFLLGSI